VIRTIVVPVDGSEASEKILPHLSELFRAADAEVRFVHVADWSAFGVRRGRRYLEDLAVRARERFPYLQTEVLKGEPWFEILRYSIVNHADLIAMTTVRSAGFRKIFFGSTALELMRHSQIPIYLTRPTWAARPIRRILVPLDGSRTSQGILPIVADLARGADARVAFLTALENVELREPAERALRRVSGRFSRRGIPVESIVRPGEPVKEILAAAREEAADLIALGSHGREGSDRFFFGSVAEAVLTGADVPLLLRRKPRRIVRQAAAAATRQS
jgi:nucleotide-binding universal stress UspA family protein